MCFANAVSQSTGFDATQDSPLLISLSPMANRVKDLLETFFDITTLCFLFERKTWLRENVAKFMMLNRCKRWFHSSRVKLPLVNMSAIWFLVSTYLMWIFGSKLILSNKQSNATLCVPETCLIVGLLPFIDHLDNCFVIPKNVQLRFTLRRICVHRNLIYIRQINVFGSLLFGFGSNFRSRPGFP